MERDVMQKGQFGLDRRDDGAGIRYAALVEALEAGVAAQLLPLLTDCLEAEKAALLRQMRAEEVPQDGAEDIANLNIIAGQILAYERRWKTYFHRAFAKWSEPPRVEVHDAFSLVSDDELQAQLIGHPTIEALERRHADVLDTIDRRLWSLAAEMGGKVRPANPFSPQHLVDSFLYTFTPADCGPRLRGALLRHFERLAGESLVGGLRLVQSPAGRCGMRAGRGQRLRHACRNHGQRAQGRCGAGLGRGQSARPGFAEPERRIAGQHPATPCPLPAGCAR
ncbi:DUF1631 family protein [Luteimonas qiangzhengi]